MYRGSGLVADLHDSVLQTSGDEELLGLHVQDEVGPDRLREVLWWRRNRAGFTWQPSGPPAGRLRVHSYLVCDVVELHQTLQGSRDDGAERTEDRSVQRC